MQLFLSPDDDLEIVETFWQADDIRNEADELLRVRDYLYNELSKKTGQPVEKVSLLSWVLQSVFLG